MKICSVGEPIARRSLAMGRTEVIVVIAKPQHSEGSADFYCAYSIEYDTQKRLSYAYGSDSVQALQLAMKKIGIDLVHLAKMRHTSIVWLSDGQGDTGFPT